MHWTSALLVGLVLSLAVAVGATPRNPQGDKLRARADAAFEAGKFEAALADYYAASKAGAGPIAMLGAARCLVQVGKWLEAEQRYRDAVGLLASLPPADAEPPKASNAQLRETATREHAELASEIPRLRLKITGAPLAAVTLTIDGKALAATQFASSATFPKGKALRLDPGEHRIVARHDEQTRSFTVRLHRGKLRAASVRFVKRQTRTQRRCRDRCRAECRGKGRNSACYLNCKQRCFSR